MERKFHAASFFTAFLAGLIFALGLGISGMVDPAKVIGFLKIGKDWDSSLLWVMGGAVPVYFVASRFSKELSHPVLACNWRELPKTGFDIPKKVMVGNILFGLGWGLSGYCPAPAIVSTMNFSEQALTFTLFMFLGFASWEFWLKRNRLFQ